MSKLGLSKEASAPQTTRSRPRGARLRAGADRRRGLFDHLVGAREPQRPQVAAEGLGIFRSI
jgi:hypothetical protein